VTSLVRICASIMLKRAVLSIWQWPEPGIALVYRVGLGRRQQPALLPPSPQVTSPIPPVKDALHPTRISSERPRGGVVTQRTANPRTPVQFRAWPPFFPKRLSGFQKS